MRERVHSPVAGHGSAGRSPTHRVVQRCGDHPCPATGCGRAADPTRDSVRAASISADGRIPADGVRHDDVSAVVQPVLSSSGSPLDPATRVLMEERFGRDFSAVRVHDDATAQHAANMLGARAWTVGSHIAFGSGQFRRDHSGDALLAHELAHVVQQNGAARTGPFTLERADSAAERQAQAVAASVSRGSGAGTREALAVDRAAAGGGPADVVRRQPVAGSAAQAAGQAGSAAQAAGQNNSAAQAGRAGPSMNTVECVRKYIPCRAPYDPGSWAAKVSYHCPVFPGTPGTTAPAFVTIPDEYIGRDERGREQYRCRPRSSVVNRLEIGDAFATALTRTMLFPDFASCHGGFRRNLGLVLSVLFQPSGGDGHTWGGRVNQAPPADFPCP